jgi:hypothetical protein
MAASQFKVYDWGDPGAPYLDGTSGSLIRVLEGCLVNGYGSKTPVGWTQPIPTVSASWGYMACFKQPSGSGCTLMVNDGAPTGSLTGSGVPVGSFNWGTTDAWATGWEFLLGFTGSSVNNTGSGQNGTGSGQFPMPGMTGLNEGLLASGSLSWQKSNSMDQGQRVWRLFGDAYTFYLFVQHNGNDAFQYSFYGFGDVFSFKPTPDNYKCAIIGKIRSLNSTAPSVDPGEYITTATSTVSPFYMQRTFSGRGQAIIVTKVGDAGKCNLGIGSTNYIPMTGKCKSTGTNNISYVSPILVSETSNGCFRGRLRGMYHPTLSPENYVDGMVVTGSNDYNGKHFQIIKRGSNGLWAVEISNTVETNDF